MLTIFVNTDQMKTKMRYINCLLILIVAMMFVGCHDRKPHSGNVIVDSLAILDEDPDSTVYGVCGEATSMHSLQLITDAGDTIQYMMLDEEDQLGDIQGGLMAGDRLAVLGVEQDGEQYARLVLNLTTLLGRWSSLDKNFEIQEGGVIKSTVKAESNPWTSWRVFNGKLLLNRDTFIVNELGADTLLLENKEGIFSYKRQK